MLQIVDYSEKSFAVVGDTKAIKDQLKALGGKFNFRLKEIGAGWIFSKSKREAVEALVDGKPLETVPAAKPAARKAKGIAPDVKEAIREYYTKVWGKDTHMVDWACKQIAHAVRLSNGIILTIEKPSIKTSFCYGESGYDYDEALDMAHVAKTDEDYFRESSLREFDDTIAKLKKTREVDQWGCHKGYAYMMYQCYTGYEAKELCTLMLSNHSPEGLRMQRYYREGSFDLLPDADYDKVLALYEEAREAFAKRIETYLKRYGLSKVKSWTYWRDA